MNTPCWLYKIAGFAWALVVGGLVSPSVALAQDQSAAPDIATAERAEQGLPLYRHFDAASYSGHPQNWDVLQDQNGILYLAGSGGVHVYDGLQWQKLDGLSSGRSLAEAADGRIYVGATDDLGVIERLPEGRFRFTSLRDQVPLWVREQGYTTWKTLANSEGIHFMLGDAVATWDGSSMRAHRFAAYSQVLGVVRDTMYVYQGEGLYAYTDTTLHPISWWQPECGSRLWHAVPYGEADVLALSFDNTLTRAGPGGCAPFSIEGVTRIDNGYALEQLADGSYVVGSYLGGFLHFDARGTLLHRVGGASSFEENSTHRVRAAPDGSALLAQNEGWTRVALNTPVSRFSRIDGVLGVAETTARYRGRLYVGTVQFLSSLNPATPTARAAFDFEPYPDVVLDLLPTSQGLLVAGFRGVMRYRPERPDEGIGGMNMLDMEGGTFLLVPSRYHVGRVFAPGARGVFRMTVTPDTFAAHGWIDGLTAPVDYLSQDHDGWTWLTNNRGGVERIQWTPDGNAVATRTTFALDTLGLPSTPVRAFTIADTTRFATSTGILQYDGSRFVPDPTLRLPDYAAGKTVEQLYEDRQGRVWANVVPYVLVGTPQAIGGYTWASEPFSAIGNTIVHAFDEDDDGVMWISAQSGLYRYAPTHVPPRHEPRPQLQGATFFGDGVSQRMPLDTAPALPHTFNTATLDFSVPAFELEGPVRYRTRLNGYEGDWSDWSPTTTRTMGNLPRGTYTLEVEAESVAAKRVMASVYTFTIRSAWYATWWGVLVLLALVGGGVLLVIDRAVRWRSRQLVARAEQLETVVAERTASLAEQKEQVEAQAEQLKELDETKNRFFANISHEFRTPLTLIRGPLQAMLEGTYGTLPMPAAEQSQRMLRNTQRLSRLVNQVLDLARLESGTFELQRQPLDAEAFVRQTVLAFAPLAERRRLDLTTEVVAPPDGAAVSASLDREQMERALANLLSNAIKFTPDGGQVTVTLTIQPDQLRIAVADTGAGIPPEALPYLFDRFYQVDDSLTRTAEGSGIGLALVKEIVELHGGTVEAASAIGAGSTFTIRLPVGDAQLPAGSAPAYQPPSEQKVLPFTKPPARPAPSGDGYADAPTQPLETPPDTDEPLVLVIDDNADVRAFVRSVLEPAGYRVEEAADGLDGLALAQQQWPDAIVCDVMMPRLDGLDASRRLKADPMTAGIPVLLLTARAEVADEVEGLETGADDYLTKPFEPAVLRARVAALIANRQRLRTLYASGAASAEPSAEPATTPSSGDPWLERVEAVVAERLHDPAFGPEALADALNLTRDHASRKLREATGLSAARFIRQRRLERGAQLLVTERDVTVSEVAYAVGFNSLSYFTRAFKQQYGHAPSEHAGAS